MNLVKANRLVLFGCLIISLHTGFDSVAVAQSKNTAEMSPKKSVTLRDVSLWRNHTVTLSDDGNWHVVQYRLATTDKIKPAKAKKDKLPKSTDAKNEDAKTDTPKNNKDELKKKEELKQIALYGKNSLTDVLYVRQTRGNKSYQIKRGARPQFSKDSQWLAYSITPEKKSKPDTSTKKSEQPSTSTSVVELRQLGSNEIKHWEIRGTSASFSFPKHTSYFALHSKSGLVLFNLKDSTEHYIGNVGEYHFSKDSKHLVYTIETEDQNGNGIYLHNIETRTTQTIATGHAKFSSISFDETHSSFAAFRSEKSQDKKKPAKVELILATGLNSKSGPTVSTQSPEDWIDMPKSSIVSTSNGLNWSQDNKRLFFKTKEDKLAKEANLKKKAESTASSSTPNAKSDATPEHDKIVAKGTVDVWHWKDEKLQSQQMMQGNRNSEKSMDVVLDIAKKTLIQLSDADVQLGERTPDGRWAIAHNRKPYISDWDVSRADIFRIDLKTGKRKLLIKRFNGRIHMFPGGKSVAYWRDGDYWIYSFENDTHRNITNGTSVSFLKNEHDYFGSEPAYGFVGVAKGGKAVILKHKHDLWLQPINGKPATCLTLGVGEEKNIRFDVAFLPNTRDKNLSIEERQIDVGSTLILKGTGTISKESGFFQLRNKKLETLVFLPKSTQRIRKAKHADVVTYTIGDFREYPETYVNDLKFEKAKKLTDTNPQQSSFKWGRRILVDYVNKDGVKLQGVLTIPDGYQDGTRLPMIVYSYEKLSDGLHRYSTPRIPAAGVSEMLYVSNDYLYFQPDIHFRLRTSHSDMHECVDAGIARVIEMGYADSARIGYVGHSYGGHAAMFMSTQPNRFAAIAGGAGVSNLIQGFNVDLVRDGTNEQDYYISGQGRLTTSPADDLGLYIQQSPVFHAKTMNTPLLLYHGTADNVVQWEHSFGFYNLLRYLKKPVIMLSYRGEGHGIRGFENRKDLHLRLKDFFDHHLKGAPAAEWIENGVAYSQPKKNASKKDSKRTVPPWK